MEIFWELNKINYQDPNILKTSINNKIFLKTLKDELIAPKMTEIANEDNIHLYFNVTLEHGQFLIIDGKEIMLEKVTISEIKPSYINKEIESQVEDFEIYPPPSFKISYKNGVLNIEGNVEENVILNLEYFTVEAYPDVPYLIDEKEINVKENYSLKLEKPKGIKILLKLESLLGEIYEEKLLDNEILYYFSNITSLKTDIVDLGVKVSTYTDEAIKHLISEKSVILKSKFGLLYEQTNNPELTPLFKTIVNLYCIKDLMALGYLTGELQSNSESEGVAPSINQIQLGNLAIKGDSSSEGGNSGGSSSKLLGTSIIEELIKIEEEKLILALREVSSNLKKWGVIKNEPRQLLRLYK